MIAYLKDIEKIICDGQVVDIELIYIKTRKREIVICRQLIMYFLKKFNRKQTLAEIGSVYGKDHATVLHAIKTVNNLIDTDKSFSCKVELYSKKIETIASFINEKLENNFETIKKSLILAINNNEAVSFDLFISYTLMVENHLL